MHIHINYKINNYIIFYEFVIITNKSAIVITKMIKFLSKYRTVIWHQGFFLGSQVDSMKQWKQKL